MAEHSLSRGWKKGTMGREFCFSACTVPGWGVGHSLGVGSQWRALVHPEPSILPAWPCSLLSIWTACCCLHPVKAEPVECGFSNQVNSMKELYLLMEEEEMNAQHSDNKACTGDSWTQNTVCLTPSGPPLLTLNE